MILTSKKRQNYGDILKYLWFAETEERRVSKHRKECFRELCVDTQWQVHVTLNLSKHRKYVIPGVNDNIHPGFR